MMSSDDSQNVSARSIAPASAPGRLLELARPRDSSAFADFVTNYHTMVFQWALAFAGDPDEAEDLTQETFIRVQRKLGQFKGTGSVEGWLYRIVRRVGIERRVVAVRRWTLGRSPLARPERDVYTTDPGNRIDRERLSALIQRYFSQLPARQQEVFNLVDLQQYTPAEAAEMTGLTAGAVRASLFKARAAIRAQLIEAYERRGDII